MKIIFFSSHTATWFFALTEAKIAYEFKKNGHEVLFLTPGSLFLGKSNKLHEKILKQEFDLDGYEIGTKLSNKDYQKIKAIVARLTKKNFEKLELEGIKIGKIALYEFLLHHKKMTTNLSNTEWNECKTEIRNALVSFFACKKIIETEKPDRIVMYNSLYSVNHVWEKYAALKKIPVYFMHHGLNLSDMDNTLIVAKNNTFFYLDELKKAWKKYKNLPITKDKVDYVTSHFEALFRAKHQLVYSSPKGNTKFDIRKQFGIDKNKKVILATMSSYDEMFAAKYVGERKIGSNLIFSTQIEWIKSLVDYVKNREKLFLIIRVHPREFPNKREGVLSEHAKLLKNILVNLPKNVVVNWPTGNLSIYDLSSGIDLVLNAWSSVGVEMSLLGIPVLTYAKQLINYPEDLNYTASSKEDYFRKLEKALKIGRDFKFTKMTYRWLALYYCEPIIRLRPKIKFKETKKEKGIVFSITNYLYSNLSTKIRSILVNSKRLRAECKKVINEHVDVDKVEKILLAKKNTLIDFSNLNKLVLNNRSEDNIIMKSYENISN